MSLYVRVCYGPYESYYTVSHKPQKLRGLRDQLLRLGFRVDLVPVEFRDYCVLEMRGRQIFRCNIKNLMLNTPCKNDPVCQRAVNAVLDASKRFQIADDYFWLRSIVEGTLDTTKLSPKNYWPRKEKFGCVSKLECLSKAFA